MQPDETMIAPRQHPLLTPILRREVRHLIEELRGSGPGVFRSLARSEAHQERVFGSLLAAGVLQEKPSL